MKKSQETQYCLSKINSKVLNYNVYVMSGTEKTIYTTLLGVAGGLIGLIFYGGLFKQDGQATILTTISNVIVFFLMGLIAVCCFLPIVRDSLKKKRSEKLKKQFCDFASALTNAVASGMNMSDSLVAVHKDLQMQYSEESLIVVEVQEIINGINNNIPIEVMLEDFGQRSGIRDIYNFSQVFSLCYRTGGNLKSILRRTTEIISEKIMIASEIDTVITSNKMQMNIMNVLPLVIVLMMRMLSREFAESFSSIIGVVGLTITAVLTACAYKLGQKIMDIKG